MGYRFFFCIGAAVLALSCASRGGPASIVQPAPEGQATLSAAFKGLTADRPDSLRVLFAVEIHNPRSRPLLVDRLEGAVSLNGMKLEGISPESALGTLLPASVPPASSLSLPLVIALGPEALSMASESEANEYRLRLDLRAAASGGEVGPSASIEALIPRIREPVLTITEIAVKRAELINTRLIVSVRVDNPNPFPVQLSSLAYELYGDGRFWADGVLSDILLVQGGASAEKRLFLVMNFINMRRELLDQIMALKAVRYRLSGSASVDTGIDYLPTFVMKFDRAGNSRVVE